MTRDQIVARDIAEVAAVRNMIAPAGTVPEFPPNLVKARAGHDGMARIFPVLEGSVVTQIELGGVACEKIVPPNQSGRKIILYFHGWGFALGSLASHRHLVAQLAGASKGVGICVDFRLAPEEPFPAGVEDGITAYRALLGQGHEAGDIVIAGDSSGGGLALSIALALKDLGIAQPAGLFLMSPWVDLSLTGASQAHNAAADFMCNRAELGHWAALYAGAAGIGHPLVSPALSDLAGIAPLLIHAGGQEILLSDSLLLAERAGMAAVRVDLMIGANMPHTWHYMWPFLTASREAIAKAGAWIASR